MITELALGIVLPIIQTIGYLGVFLLMLAESTLLPIPSEAILPFAGYLIAQGQMNLWITLLAATIGTIIGSIISYAIGKYIGRTVVLKYGKYILLDEHDLDIAKNWFYKHGEKMIFVCRFIPVIRHVISLPAGTAQMHFRKFIIYTAIGGLMWNSILIYIGIQLEQNWNMLIQYSQLIDIVAIIAIIILIIWFVKSKKSGARKTKPTKIKKLKKN